MAYVPKQIAKTKKTAGKSKVADAKHKDYFEGILQLRKGAEQNIDEILEWIKKTVKREGKAHIAKEKKVKGGVDLYMSSQKYLQSLGKRLNERFQGVLKTSRKLHTQHKITGKLLYRVNVMFKPMPFRQGEEIDFQGEKYKVVKVGAKVHLKSVETGRKRIVDCEDFR